MSRLTSLDKVRQEACRLYWAGRRREIPTADVSRLCCALQLIGSLLRDVELEQRITVLEQARL